MTVKYHVLIPSITIVAGVNDQIRLREDSVFYNAIVAPGTYYQNISFFGDGSFELAVSTALTNAVAGNTYSCVTSDLDIDPDNPSAIVTISQTGFGNDFDIFWDSAFTTFPGECLGFIDSKAGGQDTSPQVSEVSPGCLWVPDQVAEFVEPILRSEHEQTRVTSGKTFGYDRGGPFEDLEILYRWLAPSRTYKRSAVSGSGTTASLQFCWELMRTGAPLAVREHEIDTGTLLQSSGTTLGQYVLSSDQIREFQPERFSPGAEFYTQRLEFLEQPT